MSTKTGPTLRIPHTTRGKIQHLEKLKNRFSPEEREVKFALLASLRKAEIDEPRWLIRYHELLLFIRAYPDDRAVFGLACRECAEFGRRVDALCALDPQYEDPLFDSGITRTRLTYWYDYSTADWLVKWYRDALEINWEEFENTDKLETLVHLLASWVENDGLDLANISTQEWIKLAKGGASKSDLRWLLESLKKLKVPYLVRANLFDTLELPVIWELGDSKAARTHTRVPFEKPFFHSDPLVRKLKDFNKEVNRPLPEMKPQDLKTGRMLIKTVRSALSVRHRSLYPVEQGNPNEVLAADCGRGYRLVILGILPEHRMPIESTYGGLLTKNGFVIGYAVGTLLFDMVEIAVNIFDTWRGGEAAYIFAQFIRIFRSHFGCRRIKLVRYQVGHENDEGLKSGSFWFYYKQGFVPKDPEVRKLAEKELRKIKKNPAYRTPIPILKKLAVSDHYYAIKGKPLPIPEDFPLAELSLAVTRMVAERFDGDRKKALKSCALKTAKALGCSRWTAWSKDEKEWFMRLSVIVSMIPDLKTWPGEEKKSLADLMRAKGAAEEAVYARLLSKHKKFHKALWQIVADA
ncbi:MAG: hypothetical protein KJ645_02495 [Planctomycetes bacterium]|nr:hypothetical protein [Planctomycetota bacterium]